jgi:hypothetical protein
MISKLRDFSFPIVMLSAWVAVAAFTLSSLGETHARVQTALAEMHNTPELINVVAPARALSVKSHKKLSHRGPRV